VNSLDQPSSVLSLVPCFERTTPATMMLNKRNSAVYVNPPVLQGRVADIHITERGSDWLWAAFAIFGFSFLAVLGLTFRKPATHRAFHYMMAIVLFIAAMDYYAMASNLGFVPIPVEFHRSRSTVSGNLRQIWYCRYIDWIISDSLIWVALLTIARAPWQQILYIVLLTWVTIVGGLLGALVPTRYKWGWYVFGLFAGFVVAFNILVPARRHVGLGSNEVRRTFTFASAWFLALWLLYPICWGLSEGGNYIAPDSEMVFYGVLDILSKLGVVGFVLWSLRNLEPASLGIVNRGWENGTGTTAHGDKVGHHHGASTATPAV